MMDISEVCFEFFEKKLPKKGKPKPNLEWTTFSAIVQENLDSNLEVVAAGTGTKCLGESKKSLRGDLVHDSHAEVVTKRAFCRYLLDSIERQESFLVYNQNSKLFDIREGIPDK